jgi:hypothetical protein
MTQCGRVEGLTPYPWAPGLAGLLGGKGCLSALSILVKKEGWLRGLFKGCLPLVGIGE